MKILVIVVTYNGLLWVDRCLGSVRESTLPADIFVVDNDSSDRTADYIQGAFPGVRLVRSAENLGFSRANDIGLRYALEKGYDYAYLLNQDAYLEADTLEKLIAVSLQSPEFAILSPMQMNSDGSGYDMAFERDVVRRAGSLDRPVAPVPRVMAAHWLLPLGTLRTIGLFAPVFPLYGEDDNLCDRARFHGFRVGIVPSASAVHDRTYRTEPLEKTVHRNYFMGSLRRLCDIGRPLWERWLWVSIFTLVKAVKYRSRLPFKHFRTLVGLRRDILSTRTVTRAPGAFI